MQKLRRGRVGTRLEDAEIYLKSHVPDLDTRAQDPDYEDRVVMVECEAVMRVVRNPSGYTQESDGDYAYSVSGSQASGRLMILPSELSILGVDAGAYVMRAGPVMPWETV